MPGLPATASQVLAPPKVLNPLTTWAPGAHFAISSAPDLLCPTASAGFAYSVAPPFALLVYRNAEQENGFCTKIQITE